jgi:DNA-binding NarL/FixJ family response regulator
MAMVSKTELVRLQKSLGTDEAIAGKFKVTRQAIQQLRRAYGIESRYSRNPKRNKEILSLFRGGKTVIEIAKKFDLSVAHTYLLLGEARGKKR